MSRSCRICEGNLSENAKFHHVIGSIFCNECYREFTKDCHPLYVNYMKSMIEDFSCKMVKRTGQLIE